MCVCVSIQFIYNIHTFFFFTYLCVLILFPIVLYEIVFFTNNFVWPNHVVQQQHHRSNTNNKNTNKSMVEKETYFLKISTSEKNIRRKMLYCKSNSFKGKYQSKRKKKEKNLKCLPKKFVLITIEIYGPTKYFIIFRFFPSCLFFFLT